MKTSSHIISIWCLKLQHSFWILNHLNLFPKYKCVEDRMKKIIMIHISDPKKWWIMKLLLPSLYLFNSRRINLYYKVNSTLTKRVRLDIQKFLCHKSSSTRESSKMKEEKMVTMNKFKLNIIVVSDKEETDSAPLLVPETSAI